jgi:hypothetical protein
VIDITPTHPRSLASPIRVWLQSLAKCLRAIDVG